MAELLGTTETVVVRLALVAAALAALAYLVWHPLGGH